MPPKPVVTEAAIIQTAFNIVRERGDEALTARTIAAELGCSTQPIYSVLGSMDEIRDRTYRKTAEYARSMMTGYADERHSPSLNLAMGFLQFAQRERRLFRFLYLSGWKRYDLDREAFLGEDLVMTYLRRSKRLSSLPEAALRALSLKLSIYLIGIGTMINAGTIAIEMEEAEDMLREMYEILVTHEGRGRG